MESFAFYISRTSAFFQRENGTKFVKKMSSFIKAFDVHSQTVLFSFPFVFAGLSLGLLILTLLAMGMTARKTSMDHHQGLAVRLVEMIMAIQWSRRRGGRGGLGPPTFC